MARTKNRSDLVLNIDLKPVDQDPASLVIAREATHTPFRCIEPTLDTAPVISGTLTLGQTISCTTGVWEFISPITYYYRWYRDDVLVAGRTGSSFVAVEADVISETVHKCIVTAFTACGGNESESNELTVGVMPPP